MANKIAITIEMDKETARDLMDAITVGMDGLEESREIVLAMISDELHEAIVYEGSFWNGFVLVSSDPAEPKVNTSAAEIPVITANQLGEFHAADDPYVTGDFDDEVSLDVQWAMSKDKFLTPRTN